MTHIKGVLVAKTGHSEKIAVVAGDLLIGVRDKTASEDKFTHVDDMESGYRTRVEEAIKVVTQK